MNLELMISNCQQIEWRNKKEGDFSVAVVFGNLPIIILNKIPQYAFGQIENDIEIVLEHEDIGFLLERMEFGLHTKFDKLFCYIHDWKNLKQKKDGTQS